MKKFKDLVSGDYIYSLDRYYKNDKEKIVVSRITVSRIKRHRSELTIFFKNSIIIYSNDRLMTVRNEKEKIDPEKELSGHLTIKGWDINESFQTCIDGADYNSTNYYDILEFLDKIIGYGI